VINVIDVYMWDYVQ